MKLNECTQPKQGWKLQEQHLTVVRRKSGRWVACVSVVIIIKAISVLICHQILLSTIKRNVRQSERIIYM